MKTVNTPIPIIDIFAGPGGLGEGFSALRKDGTPAFAIKLSIEKDRFAHQTLELRAFFRQFSQKMVPPEYYQYLQGKVSRKELFQQYKEESRQAQLEAWKATLGRTKDETVDERIKAALNSNPNWALIGGPPCQAYSLAGRSRIRGQDKRKYARDRRHFLYKEYLKILAKHQPPVFVMENVKGMLSSTIKKQNIFEQIIRDLQTPLNANRLNSKEPLVYRLFSFSTKQQGNSDRLEPRDYIIQSEEYGIPQARHRVIIFGVRSDVLGKTDPRVLKKKSKVSIESVIGDLPKIRSGVSKSLDSNDKWLEAISAITNEKWLDELDARLRTAILKEIAKMKIISSRGNNFIKSKRSPDKHKSWYVDANLGGVCNHESRTHIREDLHRYFFASVYARVYKRSPTLADFPKALLPKHKNVSEALTGSKFNDRFRVQLRGKPSTTIVSHISKDGHYYIHYDPLQCRSLTVREAARLQTFPDNYFFEGNRTQQYHQVGNAVPPLLAKKIAEIVFDVLKNAGR